MLFSVRKLLFQLFLFFSPCVLQGQGLDTMMDEVISSDNRNNGIDVSVSVANEDELIFDLQSIAGDKSAMDVFRVFLQFSSAVTHDTFSNVLLAFRGHNKFALSGEHFHQIGLEFGEQNVIYTLRTFPEKLSPLDGMREFPSRQGGLLYVAQAQMQDFAAFNDRWFLDELKSELQTVSEPEDTRVYDDENAL